MSKLTIISVIFALIFAKIECHSYNLGNCPTIEPLSDASINKLVGRWYVIQKTNTASSCISYNISKTEEPGEYLLEEDSQYPTYLLKHRSHNWGKIRIPDETVPGKFEIKFPLTLNPVKYTLFMADYDKYAAIYTCETIIGVGNRQSATILSREKTLDQYYIEQIRKKLSSSNIDPFDLSIINQKNCPKDGLITRTSKAVGGVIKTVGEKVGDGYNYLSNGAKALINKVTDNEDDTKISGEVNCCNYTNDKVDNKRISDEEGSTDKTLAESSWVA